MMLTLEEAATRLGKSVRQVRYLIKQSKLRGEMRAGRWFVDLDDAKLGEVQQQIEERKQRQLVGAIEEALDLSRSDAPRGKRYSVLDLKAFQIALPLYRAAVEALGSTHAATTELKSMLDQLSIGCHRFDPAEKTVAYRMSRDHASCAICELILVGSAVADRIVHSAEQDLMAAFAGLLRRVDRKKSW